MILWIWDQLSYHCVYLNSAIMHWSYLVCCMPNADLQFELIAAGGVGVGGERERLILTGSS